MRDATIRAARGGDFGRLGEMFERAGLGGPSMAATLELVQARLRGAAFVAEAGDGLVGASAAVGFGSTGWVGGVAVLPERRGAGLGAALTGAAVGWLRRQGAATVSLHATDLGRPVYERLGFTAEGRWLLLAAAAVRTGSALPPWTRPGRPGDLGAVLALDRAATGEDRSRLLQLLWDGGAPATAAAGAPVTGRRAAAAGAGAGNVGPATGDTFLVAEDAGGRVVGFHAPRPTGGGGGATVATDPAAGAVLLAAWQRPGAPATAVLPEANPDGRRALEALGYQVARATTLMRLGPAPARRPELVFGGFNLFWG
jgi:GNAT superfamily N-acetyltransferase